MEECMLNRTNKARKLTRKKNELLNAIHSGVHPKEAQEKISIVKACMEELGDVHDEYITQLDETDVEGIDRAENWYREYDKSTNLTIIEAREYLERSK